MAQKTAHLIFTVTTDVFFDDEIENSLDAEINKIIAQINDTGLDVDLDDVIEEGEYGKEPDWMNDDSEK